MTTVADVIECLNRAYPLDRKESWDRAGFNCGHLNAPVTRVLVALDPFRSVCREAKDWGAELLVTHHTLLWDTQFVTDETESGRNTLFLIENGIACFNAHTVLDFAPDGVNEVLARTVGLSDIHVISPVPDDASGREWGLLRYGYVPEQPLESFLTRVKESLHVPVLRYVDGGEPVRKVAVGGGACGGEMQDVIRAGCDTFITSDLKYNDFWDARALGLSLIDAGHFYTENPVCSHLADRIRSDFPQLEVRVSRTHRDCMEFA